ncbi:MAG: amidohydrolase family protein, partial [Gammaproteobacteria bacterium]
EAPPGADDPGIADLVRTATTHGLPVNVLCWDKLAFMDGLARRYPDAQLVLDHLGLRQHFERPPPAAPFAALDSVLALADHPNLAIKITAAATLSHMAFPYADLWDPLARLFDAFGLERCLWGTDWTRATAFLTYAEGVDAFRLSTRLDAHERAMLMGGNSARLYRWQPRGRAPAR